MPPITRKRARAVGPEKCQAKTQKRTMATSTGTGLNIEHTEGHIFDAPDDAVLIHSCNCIGVWGSGIAAAFKAQYPRAFEIYKKHCQTGAKVGTALLIPPVDSGKKHFIGCLFTSRGIGKKKDQREAILASTQPAMQQLLAELKNAKNRDGKYIGEIRMAKINSGLFDVPWQSTEKLLKGIKVSGDEAFSNVTVYTPDPAILRPRKGSAHAKEASVLAN